MADPNKRVPKNVPGDFFVDSTYIDCDTCRQIAPKVFGDPVTPRLPAEVDGREVQGYSNEDRSGGGSQVDLFLPARPTTFA